MKFITENDKTTVEFENEEMWTLAEYLKGARAFGVPTSEAQWALVSQLIRRLESTH